MRNKWEKKEERWKDVMMKSWEELSFSLIIIYNNAFVDWMIWEFMCWYSCLKQKFVNLCDKVEFREWVYDMSE